jgi:Na+-translocating ferredoxin:NAD+ oxidoreductase subunit B
VGTEKDVYHELAEMVNKEDLTGSPETPAFLKLLSLYCTPAEAQLALHIHLTGSKFDEIAERSGIAKPKLKKMLYTMADKGVVYYNPRDKDPVYRIVGMAAPGLIETGLWGNIRFPNSVELGKNLRKVLIEWSENRLAKLGIPFAPVWAGVASLPKDALPSEDLREVLRDAGHWSVAYCPCRLSRWITEPGKHCNHMLQTCLQTGDLSRWTVKHGMSRELTYKQMVDFLKKCNEDGLVHTLNVNHCVCNCCSDCCAMFHAYHTGANTFIPSPFMAKADADECNACKVCVKRCPVGAIKVEEVAVVDPNVCLGCGACVPTCKTQAMSLVRRPKKDQIEIPSKVKNRMSK